jgi:hypothetical protein
MIQRGFSLNQVRVTLAIVGIVTILLIGWFFFGDFIEDGVSVTGLMCYVVTFVFSLLAVPVRGKLKEEG